MDEYLNIDTPENVVFGYEIAGIGSRFLAAMIDTLLILALQVVAFGLLAAVFAAGNLNDTLLELGAAVLVAASSFIAFAFLWGYYIFFEIWWNGQTPGKRVAGLRVIKRDGTPISLTESLIRNLVRIIDFLPAYYGVGVVTMFFDGQSRRLGDMAASTLVVFDRTGVTLESLQEATRRPAGNRTIAYEVAQLPVKRLGQADLQMAESLLARQAELPNAETLAQRILVRLYHQMEVEPPALSAKARMSHISDIVHFAMYPDAPVAAPVMILRQLPERLPVHLLNPADFQVIHSFLHEGQFAEDGAAAGHALAARLMAGMGLTLSAYEVDSDRALLRRILRAGQAQGML